MPVISRTTSSLQRRNSLLCFFMPDYVAGVKVMAPVVASFVTVPTVRTPP